MPQIRLRVGDIPQYIGLLLVTDPPSGHLLVQLTNFHVIPWLQKAASASCLTSWIHRQTSNR